MVMDSGIKYQKVFLRPQPRKITVAPVKTSGEYFTGIVTRRGFEVVEHSVPRERRKRFLNG